MIIKLILSVPIIIAVVIIVWYKNKPLEIKKDTVKAEIVDKYTYSYTSCIFTHSYMSPIFIVIYKIYYKLGNEIHEEYVDVNTYNEKEIGQIEERCRVTYKYKDKSEKYEIEKLKQ